MTLPVVRKRAKHYKVRSGCQTCRARHVKCDEEKPVCRRCKSSGRTCLGYHSRLVVNVAEKRALTPIAPKVTNTNRRCHIPRGLANLKMQLDPMQSSAFDFFCKETIHQLPGGSSDLSWELLVLQTATQQTIVTYAVVALASLHRAITNNLTSCPESGCADDRYQFASALEHYSKALSGLLRLIRSFDSEARSGADTQLVLMMMLLLFCFEVIHGQDDQAALHLRTASQILNERLSISPGEGRPGRRSMLMREKPRDEIDVLAHTIVRLYSDSFLPYIDGHLQLICDRPSPNGFFVLEEANVHLDVLSSQITEIESEIADRARIDQMGPAYKDTEGSTLCDDTHQVYQRADTTELAPKTTRKLEDARRDIRAWMNAFTYIPVTQENEMEHCLTRIFCFYVWIRIETWDCTPETDLGHFHEQFDYIVGVAESYVDSLLKPSPGATNLPHGAGVDTWLLLGLTLGTGLLSCLCLIITKCRDPSIRQRCMRLLQTIKPRGSFYSCDIISRMKAVIDTEVPLDRACQSDKH